MRSYGRKKASRSDRLLTPTFVAALVTTLLAYIAGQALNSGTSIYLARVGDSAVYAGSLGAIFSFAAGVSRLISGRMIDEAGRARMMTAGGLIIFAGALLPVLVDSGFVFVASRFIQGFGFSAATTAAATVVVDVLPESRLGEGIGYYGLGSALATSVGPLAGVALASSPNPVILYQVVAAITAVTVVLSLFCRYEKHPLNLPSTSAYRIRFEDSEDCHKEEKILKGCDGLGFAARADRPTLTAIDRIKDGVEVRALPGAVPMALACPAFAFGTFFVGLYGSEMGVSSPGLFFTLSAASMILVRASSDRYMDSVAPLKVFLASSVCGVASFLLLLLAGGNDVLFYIAGVFYGAYLGICVPVLQTVAVKNTSPDRWGRANALVFLGYDVGSCLGAALWGGVIAFLGFHACIVMVMLFIVAAGVVAVAMVRF